VKFERPQPPAPPAYLVKNTEISWLPTVFRTAAEAEKAAAELGLDHKKAVHPFPPPDGGTPFPTPMHKAWLAYMIEQRHIIPKSRLEDGVWYAGRCRNADVAQWDTGRSVFVYWREKFGRNFAVPAASLKVSPGECNIPYRLSEALQLLE